MVVFKAAGLGNPGAVTKRAGLSSYISRHVFRKLLNTSASNKVLLWAYKSYSPNFVLFQNLYRPFFCACNMHQ